MNGTGTRRQFILKGRSAKLPSGLCDASKESLTKCAGGVNSLSLKRRPPRGVTADQRRGIYILSAAMIVFLAAVVVKWLA
jgi:hypothetical protein